MATLASIIKAAREGKNVPGITIDKTPGAPAPAPVKK